MNKQPVAGERNDSGKTLGATANARVTKEERALIEAAAARAGETFVSSWLRSVILDRLEEEFGPKAVGRAGGSSGE